MPVLVGTSGWQYRHWRDVFYPAGVPQRLWLEHYAKRFPTVENNGSFYRLPAGTSSSSAASWLVVSARSPRNALTMRSRTGCSSRSAEATDLI